MPAAVHPPFMPPPGPRPLKNLVQMRKTEGLGVFTGARLVESLDANNQIVAQQWRAAGMAGG